MPSVTLSSTLTELDPERISSLKPGTETAQERNRSNSPSSGTVTFHFMLLESLQSTEIFRPSNFALPPISTAVEPYRRVSCVSPRTRGLDWRESGDRSDRAKPVPAESALAAPVSMTFRKLPLLRASDWANVFVWFSSYFFQSLRS